MRVKQKTLFLFVSIFVIKVGLKCANKEKIGNKCRTLIRDSYNRVRRRHNKKTDPPVSPKRLSMILEIIGYYYC